MYFTDDSLFPENMQPTIITAAPYGPEWMPGDVEDLPLSFDQQVFGLRVQSQGLDLGIALHARPDAAPLLVTEGSAFGSGFIGWGLVPRLLAGGELWACGAKAAIRPCY